MDAKVQAKDEGWRDAWHESVHDPSGLHPEQLPIKALASIAGISATHLYATADREERVMPSLGTYLAILPNLRNLAVLDFQERICGRVAFRIPDAREVCGEQMGASLKEYGEFVMEASSAGPWTPEKAARIEKEGREAMASIAAIIECAKQQVQQPNLRAVPGGAR